MKGLDSSQSNLYEILINFINGYPFSDFSKEDKEYYIFILDSLVEDLLNGSSR